MAGLVNSSLVDASFQVIAYPVASSLVIELLLILVVSLFSKVLTTTIVRKLLLVLLLVWVHLPSNPLSVLSICALKASRKFLPKPKVHLGPIRDLQGFGAHKF